VDISDYASILDPEPFSIVPLQFLLSVYEGSGNCKQNIRFSRLTIQDKSCVGVTLNTIYRDKIYASTGSTESM